MAKKAQAVPWKLVAMVVAVFVVLALVQWIPPVRSAMESVVEWGQGIMESHPVGGAAVFFLFSAASPMLAFVSSALLVPPATEAWGRPLTFVLLWGGWMTGIAMAYGLARLALPMVRRMGHGQALDEYRDLVSKRVSLLQAFIVCLAVPSEIPAYLFGAVRYPFAKFMLAAGLSEGIYALAMVIAGERLLEADAKVVMPVAGALLALIIGASLYLRRRKVRKAR